MISKFLIITGIVCLTLALFVGIAVAQEAIDTGPTPNIPEIHGGLLYDKWWDHIGVDVPEGDHPLWATQTTNTRTGTDTWRCKECHGWDYFGKDGAYGSGSHLTGFPGVYDARTKTVDEIVAALKGATNPDHDFSIYMSDADLANLAAFIQGLRDFRQYVDYSAKAPIGGDAANGKALFDAEQGCQWCHGLDGAKINFGDAEEPEFLGTIAVDNPQEFMHKAIYGQPASDPRMFAAIERGWAEKEVVDILAYAQSLPTGLGEAPAPAPAAQQAPAALPVSGGSPFDISLLLLICGVAVLAAGLICRRKLS
jgi:thiosulfate dehydrogenase